MGLMAIVATASVVACTNDSDTGAPEDLTLAEGAVAGPVPPAALIAPPPVCPPLPSPLLQKKVSAAYQYIAGGVDPLIAYPCLDGSKSIPAITVLHNLARAAASGGPATASCNVAGGTLGTACGLVADLANIDCDLVRNDDYNTIRNVNAQLDQCWGTGASGFFSLKWSYNEVAQGTWRIHLTVDPEPAHLTAALPDSQGASATAYWANTYGPTNVVRWAGTWIANTTLAGGTPCSTIALSSGSLTTTFITASGNYRKCQ